MRDRAIELLRVLVLTTRSVLLLPVGLVWYAATGRTPGFAHQALIWLFCITSGRSNDWLSSLIRRYRPPVQVDTPMGVLGDMSGARLREATERLRTDGFVVFERALPETACDRLLEFARRNRCLARAMDGKPRGQAEPILFDPEQPGAVRYDYSASLLLDNPEVQALLADLSIITLAQAYLGCRPVADVLNMWWHTSYLDRPDAQAAQFFHFDMDRIKWLKVFIYLSDVGADNGPHSFVRGSQRTGGIPRELLLRGYERLTDEDVQRHYPNADCLEFSAPRGSIICEDTRGLHKGAHVRGTPRLILQLQWSNSLFGATYEKARMTRVTDPTLRRMLRLAPEIYSQFT